MKKTAKIITVILLVFSIVTFGACKISSSNGFNFGRTDSSEYETYYGCPNSKRVKKLNLKKVSR